MILFSAEHTTEYGTTAQGNYFECKRSKGGTIFRSTPYVRVFLQWLIASEEQTINNINHFKKNKNDE